MEFVKSWHAQVANYSCDNSSWFDLICLMRFVYSKCFCPQWNLQISTFDTSIEFALPLLLLIGGIVFVLLITELELSFSLTKKMLCRISYHNQCCFFKSRRNHVRPHIVAFRLTWVEFETFSRQKIITCNLKGTNDDQFNQSKEFILISQTHMIHLSRIQYPIHFRFGLDSLINYTLYKFNFSSC